MPLRVWCVFPTFPAETFAASDVRVLRELGVGVEAVNLRCSPRGARTLLPAWGLDGLPVDEVTVGKLTLGVVEMVRRPALAAWALAMVVRECGGSREHLLKSLLVLPRCFQLLRRCLREQPDVVHLFWGHYASLLGLLVRRASPRRVVTMFLGAYDLRTRYPLSARLGQQADRVFTHARANLPALRELGIGEQAVEVVYRGLDLNGFDGVQAARVPFRIATAGRLIPAKGVADVVEAYARLRGHWPAASLCIIGDGPERRSLLARVAALGLPGVEFTGWLPHQEVLHHLRRAEVFLFLSKKPDERLPNVVKEAMAMGCACVVSRTVGIEELVPSDEHGIVVNVGDVEGAVAAVGRLFADAPLRRRLAEAGREHVHAHFDARTTLRRYVKVWEEAVFRRMTAAGSSDGPGVGRRHRTAAPSGVA